MNVKGALRCITELLSNDEDLLDLLLTEKAIAKSEDRTLPIESHANVEMILEEYARQLNSTLLEIDYMLQRVQSKQDMLALQLDAYRNRMIRMNLYLSMGGISMGFGTAGKFFIWVHRVLLRRPCPVHFACLLCAAVAGFFGMNVINGLENADGVFNVIVASSTMIGLAFTAACYSYINGSR